MSDHTHTQVEHEHTGLRHHAHKLVDPTPTRLSWMTVREALVILSERSAYTEDAVREAVRLAMAIKREDEAPNADEPRYDTEWMTEHDIVKP